MSAVILGSGSTFILGSAWRSVFILMSGLGSEFLLGSGRGSVFTLGYGMWSAVILESVFVSWIYSGVCFYFGV